MADYSAEFLARVADNTWKLPEPTPGDIPTVQIVRANVVARIGVNEFPVGFSAFNGGMSGQE